MRWIKWLFFICGFYGVLVLAPLYFQEGKLARAGAPAITYPEFFYGFIGVALAWQTVFLLISSDPRRYRELMLVGVIEKLGFGIPAALLYQAGRIKMEMFAAGVLDLVMAVLFTLAWIRMRKESSA